MPNCLPYILLQGTVESYGLVIYQLNPTWQSEQLARLVPKGKPTLLITVSQLLPNIRKFDKDIKVLLVDTQSSDVEHHLYSYKDIENTEVDLQLLDNIRQQIKPDDVLYYGCTSGSTGEPKICVYTHKRLVGNALQMGDTFPLVRNKNFLTFVPFFTTTGNILVSSMFIQGYQQIFVDKFYPEKLFQIIEKEKPTGIPASPAAFLALINHPSKNKYDISSLRECIIGGAASSNEALEHIKNELNVEYVSSAFGMTEGCGLLYNMPVKSSGYPAKPIKYYEARIVDKKTREIVDIGFPGELEFKSEILMKEYLNNEVANAQAFTKDGWFRTGDEAVLENDGLLKITGRIKDMILRGGHNVWPNEIIDAINQHPKIQETAVIGIPDKFQGESIVAFVITKPECQFNNIEKELRDYLKDKLVPYSIPTYYFDLPQFPRNSSGKVYVPKLREIVNDLIQDRFKKLESMNNDKPLSIPGKELAQLWSEWFDVPMNTISRSTNFFDMGGDSLVGVQTIHLIKKYYQEVSFNFLNSYQTLGEIEDFLITPEKSIDIKKDSQLQKDFDDVQKLSAKEIFGDVNPHDQKREKRCVVVTGAVGYLGIYVVKELVKKSNKIDKVYCIGRGSNISELKSKMLTMMRKVNMKMSDKIELVIGDITKHNCAIKPDILEKIQKECSALIHCAAVVNWNKPYQQLKDANVTGVINAMKVAGPSMQFVYISSFGAALGKDEQLSNIVPNDTFGYIQTKWLSEHYVNKGREIGIHSTIIRPCYIVADSKTGVCNTNDFVYKFIKQCIHYQIAPSGVLLDLTPVNKVAKGIVKYMYSDKIINLTPAKQTSTDELFYLYNKKNYGSSINLIDKDQWLQQFLEKSKNDHEALSLIPSLGIINMNYSVKSEVLKGKNKFLNFKTKDMKVNLKKLHDCKFFVDKESEELISRTIC